MQSALLSFVFILQLITIFFSVLYLSEYKPPVSWSVLCGYYLFAVFSGLVSIVFVYLFLGDARFELQKMFCVLLLAGLQILFLKGCAPKVKMRFLLGFGLIPFFSYLVYTLMDMFAYYTTVAT